MTVQNVIVKNIYAGNGSNTSWPYTFACPEDHPEFIKAYIKDPEGNVHQTEDFRVDTSTKTVIFPVSGKVLSEEEKIVIARELPLYQVLNLVNQGPFFAEDLEVTFDELVMMIQQLNEKLERTMSFSIDVDQKKFDPNVPIAAGKTFRINNDGTGFEVTADPEKVYNDCLAISVNVENNAETAQNAANVAEAIKGDVEEIAGNYSLAKDVLDNVNAYKNQAQAAAITATTKATEASTSATNASNSASVASQASNTAIETLRATQLIANSGNADTLSTANAANIIQLSESITEISDAVFSFGDFSEIIPDEGYPIYGKVCNLNTQLPQDLTGAMYAKYTIHRNKSNIKVSGKSRTSVPAFALGAFYDEKGAIISVFGEITSTKYTQEEIKIPSNASYVIVNGDYPLQSGVRVPYLAVEQAEIVDNVMEHDKSNISMNHWYGKKIVLLGTSVGYGQNADTNYITECARKLGFSFVNTSVPGMAICLDDDGTPCDNKKYASILSLQEYADIGYTIPSDKSDSHYYCSWERIFTEETADADLYIFAVAPNNSRFETTDWDAFDKTNWRYTDGSSFESHRTTFLGGLLFLMNKMYELNPNARMCIVVDSNFRYGQYGATPNLETFVKQYKIPYIDLWGKINGTPQSLRLMYSLNGTDQHPSTMAHKIMGKMLVGELMSIS